MLREKLVLAILRGEEFWMLADRFRGPEQQKAMGTQSVMKCRDDSLLNFGT